MNGGQKMNNISILKIIKQFIKKIIYKLYPNFNHNKDTKFLQIIRNNLILNHSIPLYDDKYGLASTEKYYLRWRFEDFSLSKISIEKLQKLYNGLDEKSILTINTILSRLDKVCNIIHKSSMIKNKLELDLFTLEEKEHLIFLKEFFFANIIKLSDTAYCYQNYLLPVKGFTVAVFFNKHEMNEINDQSKLLNKDIIDVGGWIGDSALILSKYTNSNVYSFEAVSQNFKNLEMTVKMNSLKNVIPIHSALGSHEGTIFIEDSNSGSFTNSIETQKSEIVKLNTLDNFVKMNDLNVGLIKVDIEGGEQDFLKGAIQTINNFRPVLLLSIYHTIDDFFDIKPFIESMNLGYSFKIIKPIDGNIMGETVLIGEIE